MPVRNDSGSLYPVTRSRSFFGSLKSLLPSRIWGGESGGQTDTPGKRKGVDEAYEAEGGQRSSKRQKVGSSPVREITRPQSTQRQQLQLQPAQTAAMGYLEPPDDFFGPVNTAGVHRQPGHARASSLAPLPRRPTNGSTRMLSPVAGVQGRSFTRTQSMDPPNRYRPVFGAAPKAIPLSRDVSMDDGSFSKGLSVSPTQQPFRMRTSLTPQPNGQAFGPEPVRRERNESEPPPLAQLIDRPMFIKAPSEAAVPKSAARQTPNTLGALVEAQRTGKGTQRSHSSLKLGSDSSMQDLTETPAAPARPITQTERMIRELEVYKTPLLPTRLRGSTTIPDMFKPKKGHAPVLMHDRESRPRLGTADKLGASEKVQEEGHGAKPYAGRGGMKKLLARRRLEEDEENEKAKAAAIETDEDEAAETTRQARALDEKLVKEFAKPVDPVSQPAGPFVGGREQSSLRVGRQRTSRNHIDRPKAKHRAGRFSAVEEDEDEDAMDDDSREAKDGSPKKPTFEPPPGFSFAKDTAPIQHDATNAKEPPITTLPFSLMKSTPSAPTSVSETGDSSKLGDKPNTISLSKDFPSDRDVPHPSPPITASASSQSIFAPAPLTPLINTVPQIALIPPSPGSSSVLATAPKQPAAEQLDASLTGKGSSAVPNFFATSTALSKPSAQVNVPSSFSFGLPPTTATPSAAAAKEVSSFFSKPSATKEDAPPKSTFNLFGAPAIASQTSTDAADEKNKTEASKPALASPFMGFGSKEPVSVFPKSPAPAPSASPEPPKAPESAKETPSTTAPSTSPFTFGKPAEKPAVPSPAPTSLFPFGAPSKPVGPPTSSPSPLPFQFGPPPTKPTEAVSTSDSRPSTGDALKPPFSFGGAGSQPSPFGGLSATPSPSAVEAPKSPFAFGQTVAQPAASVPPTQSTPSPAVEAPKPVFGTGFNFGQPSASSAPESAKSPFTFGNPPTAPSTPVAENKPFAFGAPAATPAPAGGSTLFGSAATGRTTTPPKKEDSEIMMDESPTRGITMEVNGKPELPKLNGGFGNLTANAPSSPFGQPTQTSASPFGFGSAAATSSPFGAKAETKPAEKTPFGFGQATTTGGFFGQKAPEASAAPSAGGFSFGSKAPETSAPPMTNAFSFNSPATPTAPATSPFNFGAPIIAPSTSFGAPASATSSAAPSPNPFTQPAQPNGFNFGAATPTTATTPSNPFAFGSQPASPAVPSAGLPGQNGAGGFAFGATSAAPASSPSPFAAPSALPQTGGAVFNMGAAPPPVAGMAGRQMKKLPNRRGKR